MHCCAASMNADILLSLSVVIPTNGCTCVVELKRVYTQESEILLTKDKFEWDQHMKGLWEEEVRKHSVFFNFNSHPILTLYLMISKLFLVEEADGEDCESGGV